MNDQKINLLLVEDDEDDYLIMETYLRELNFWNIEHHWVTTPDAALKTAKAQTYDICFVDYMLGDLNGIELIQELKQKGFDAPIVMLTGKANRELDLLAMEKGISDFIEKSDLNSVVIERCIRYTIERSNALKDLDLSRARLKSISEQLVGAQEQERKVVAQELHDSIGSSLAAIKFALESKLDQIHKKRDWEKGIHIETIVDMAGEAMNEARRISRNLRPPTLDSMGILVTISWMCREFQNVYNHIQIETDIQVRETDIPETLKIIIYRILQEVLTNAAKHSRADTVWIRFGKSDSDLTLEVSDNGQGIGDQDMLDKPLGFGIESIKHRCELSNGTLALTAPTGKGTAYKITWPI
jgi:signal transduction histidine kinase